MSHSCSRNLLSLPGNALGRCSKWLYLGIYPTVTKGFWEGKVGGTGIAIC
jgi:hypothetical protein